jgi:hypothetical protein
MLTVRNLRPQPTKRDWLRANGSSIAALFLWACAMAMLAEVGQPDGEQDYSVTSAEGAMFFSRTSEESTCEADAVKFGRALDHIDCGVAPPTYEKN